MPTVSIQTCIESLLVRNSIRSHAASLFLESELMNMKCMPQKVASLLFENIGPIRSFPSSSPVFMLVYSFSDVTVMAAVPFLKGF